MCMEFVIMKTPCSVIFDGEFRVRDYGLTLSGGKNGDTSKCIDGSTANAVFGFKQALPVEGFKSPGVKVYQN